MTYIAAYAAALIVFLVVDALWLMTVMKPVFERYVPDLLRESPMLGVAGGFYAVYVAGLVYFAVLPAVLNGSWLVAALHGAMIGFIAYGTYEATNMATLKGWTYGMMALDIAWGTALSALASVVAYAAAQAVAGT